MTTYKESILCTNEAKWVATRHFRLLAPSPAAQTSCCCQSTSCHEATGSAKGMDYLRSTGYCHHPSVVYSQPPRLPQVGGDFPTKSSLRASSSGRLPEEILLADTQKWTWPFHHQAIRWKHLGYSNLGVLGYLTSRSIQHQPLSILKPWNWNELGAPTNLLRLSRWWSWSATRSQHVKHTPAWTGHYSRSSWQCDNPNGNTQLLTSNLYPHCWGSFLNEFVLLPPPQISQASQHLEHWGLRQLPASPRGVNYCDFRLQKATALGWLSIIDQGNCQAIPEPPTFTVTTSASPSEMAYRLLRLWTRIARPEMPRTTRRNTNRREKKQAEKITISYYINFNIKNNSSSSSMLILLLSLFTRGTPTFSGSAGQSTPLQSGSPWT